MIHLRDLTFDDADCHDLLRCHIEPQLADSLLGIFAGDEDERIIRVAEDRYAIRYAKS